MTKFTAQKLTDLWSDEANAGRLLRRGAWAGCNIGFNFLVACEASDGSWCELDAEDFAHAKRLADNAVDKLGCRGASVWALNAETGAYARGPSLYIVTEEVGHD